MNPLDGNALESRADFRSAVRTLYEPLVPHRSDGNARVKPSAAGASFPDVDAGLEGFARPLWGLVPLAEGGGSFEHWDAMRDGLANGTDPSHPEYWGPATDYSQKVVEMAPIAYGVAAAPDHLWLPFSDGERERVVTWLRTVNDVELPDNNWRFFRVFVNHALRTVGAAYDAEQLTADLDRLESFYREDGWYVDGSHGHYGYYVPWSMHLYALLFASLTDESPRSERFRSRASAFAEPFRRWFAADGSAVPFGRSQIYRFAQGCFWGGLAYADVDALPWGTVRGLWQRNLQWWAEQPIFTDGGVLSLGYRYPTNKVTEPYNSPSSPYWAFKFFLPLALPSSHPFWQADPEPLSLETGAVTQSVPGVVLCRSAGDDHTVLLSGGQASEEFYTEKYNKFAYSNRYGFSVADGPSGLYTQAPDNTLLLTADGRSYRRRTAVERRGADDGVVRSRWQPWSDVTVDTWLVADVPWHVRVHRIRADRSVESVEGGFPFPRDGAVVRSAAGDVRVRTDDETSRLVDATHDRPGDTVEQSPNANLLHPRTTAPVLRGVHEAGDHTVGTAVYAGSRRTETEREATPSVELTDGGFRVTGRAGERLVDHRFDDE